MIQYPYGYQQTLTRSHQMALYAVLQRPGSALPPQTVPIMSGQVTLDATASFRGMLSCDIIVDPARGFMLPTSGELMSLAPYGNEISVYRGIRLPEAYKFSDAFFGNVFFAQLGVFRISEDSIEDAGEGGNLISVTAYDRSRTVSRNKFTTPWVVGAGTLYSDAITAIILDRMPFLDPNYDLAVTPTSDTTPLLVFDAESDPWEKIQEMAASVGMVAYFDGGGKFTLKFIDQSPQETWLYEDGANAIVTGISRRISDEPGYNGVLISSESTTLVTPIKAEVWDVDPDSPTYSEGPYGRVPKIMTSPYVTSQEQGTAMADTELQKVLGITEQVSLTVVPNVIHEPGDLIRLKRLTPAWDLEAVYADTGLLERPTYSAPGGSTTVEDTQAPIGEVDNGSLYQIESVVIGLSSSDTMQINGKARVVN